MRLLLGIGLACVVAVAIGAYALGAASSSNDVVLCAAKKGGALSLAAKGKCGKGQKKLTIAKQGPKGDAGAPGKDGAAAATTLEAIHYVTGPATLDCASHPGTFCAPELGNYFWTDLNEASERGGFEDAGFYKDPDGLVHLVGAATYDISGGVGPGAGLHAEGPFYLPPGFRPAHREVFLLAQGPLSSGGFSEEARRIEVEPDGLVALVESTISFSGVSFRAG